MDQGVASTTGTHYARLLLIFFGAVLGFLALSFVFGSSSASADDGGDSPGLLDPVGGIIASTTAPVADTVTAVTGLATAPAATPVTAIATPAAAAADEAVSSLLGDAAGAPVTSIIIPVTTLADTALTRLQDAAAPLVTPVTGALAAATAPATGLASDAVTASGTVFPVSAAVLGVAAGQLGTPVPGGLPQPDATGAATASGALAAVAAGIGFALLLMRRARPLLPVIVPGAPVFDTDSSPD